MGSTAGALHGAFQAYSPLLPTKVLSAAESQLKSDAGRFSQHRDAAWLSQVHKPIKWASFNGHQAGLVKGSSQKPKTLVEMTMKCSREMGTLKYCSKCFYGGHGTVFYLHLEQLSCINNDTKITLLRFQV